MPTRRTVLASPLVAAAAATLPGLFATGARAAPAFVRHDVASPEGKAMLKIYARGVKVMKALPASNPRSWTWQWYIHAAPRSKAALIRTVFHGQTGPIPTLAQATWWTCQAHVQPPENEASFLPWHRLYLARFEAIVRTLTNEPGFTLPYWNYTDPARAAIPDEFQDRFAADPDFGILHVAHRNRDDGRFHANVNAGEPINKYFKGRENFLTLADMSTPVYGGSAGFNQMLDSHLHGDIHTFVGDESNMGDIPSAANDPLFWLHHCNIDRIWYGWSKAGGRLPADPTWYAKSFTFVDAQGKSSTAAVRTIADVTKLDYGYDALPTPPKPFAPPAVAAASQGLVALRAAAPAAMMMTAASPPPAVRVAASAPVALGAAPQQVTVAPPPAAPHPAPHGAKRATAHPESLVPETAAAPARLLLHLNSVKAHAAPGVVYKIYLDLSADASPEVAGDHFVGLLNFFDKVAMPQQGMAMSMGKTVSFDITEVADRIRAPGEADADFKVTLVPVGDLKANAAPLIAGGISVTRE